MIRVSIAGCSDRVAGGFVRERARSALNRLTYLTYTMIPTSQHTIHNRSSSMQPRRQQGHPALHCEHAAAIMGMVDTHVCVQLP